MTNRERPNKSAAKRKARDVHALTTKLSKIAPAKLPGYLRDQVLLNEFIQFHRLKSNNARRRHLNFLARRLRGSSELEYVSARFAQTEQNERHAARLFKETEVLRQQFLDGTAAAEERLLGELGAEGYDELLQQRSDYRRLPEGARKKGLFRQIFRTISERATGSRD